MRVGVLSARIAELLTLVWRQLKCQRTNYVAGDLVLQVEHVIKCTVVPLGPEMAARCGVDQLRVDADLVCRTPYAALQDIADAEFLCDLPDLDTSALVGERGIAGYDEETGYLRQVRDDVFGKPI